MENSCGRVSGFRRGGGDEAKKSKNSLWELTLRLKRRGSSPSKYFFHIFVIILEDLPVGRLFFFFFFGFMTDKEIFFGGSTRAQSAKASTGGEEGVMD